MYCWGFIVSSAPHCSNVHRLFTAFTSSSLKVFTVYIWEREVKLTAYAATRRGN